MGKRAEAQSGILGYLGTRPGQSWEKHPNCLCPLAQDGDPMGSSSTRRVCSWALSLHLSHFPSLAPCISQLTLPLTYSFWYFSFLVYLLEHNKHLEAKQFANKIRSQPLHRQCRSYGPRCATDHRVGQLIHTVAFIFLTESKGPHTGGVEGFDTGEP